MRTVAHRVGMRLRSAVGACLGLLAMVLVESAVCAEWQWSVPMEKGRAFLWIPPKCQQVRDVVVERQFVLTR